MERLIYKGEEIKDPEAWAKDRGEKMVEFVRVTRTLGRLTNIWTEKEERDALPESLYGMMTYPRSGPREKVEFREIRRRDPLLIGYRPVRIAATPLTAEAVRITTRGCSGMAEVHAQRRTDGGSEYSWNPSAALGPGWEVTEVPGSDSIRVRPATWTYTAIPVSVPLTFLDEESDSPPPNLHGVMTDITVDTTSDLEVDSE